MGKKFVLSQEDGTAANGNLRGDGAVDLQMARNNASQVVSGSYSIILAGASNKVTKDYSISGGINCSNEGRASVSFGNNNTIALNCDNAGILCGNANTLNSGDSAILSGRTNTLTSAYGVIAGGQGNTGSTSSHVTISGGSSNISSSQYGTVSGGQSNTASTGTHATVVGGQSNTASGIWSIAGGYNNTASGLNSFAAGREGTAAQGQTSFAFGRSCIAQEKNSIATGEGTRAYLFAMRSHSGIGGFISNVESQISDLIASKLAVLASNATTVLSLDGTGVTNLIIPFGTNRAWNVQVNWVAVVTEITGTATGITVGDIITGESLFGFKKIGGVSSIRSFIRDSQAADTAIMDTCSLAYSAGASQELAMTFTGPTFAGGGSVTMRIVAKVELVEVAY